MQTRALKILIISVFLLSTTFSASKAQMILNKADSLFKGRQYTQSFALYQNIYESGRYSPAMLLKMAYIQEGLGQVSKSIYYLQLYHQATNNEPTLRKIEQLADKNKLEGYAATDQTFFRNILKKYESQLSIVFFAIALFLLALVVYQKRKYARPPIAAGIALLTVLVVLFVQVNFSAQSQKGIIAEKATYLMSGPSAGASVVAVVGAGHQLKVTGEKDIWLRVQWMDQEAYVKRDKLLFAEI